jgi:hypothetical protein
MRRDPFERSVIEMRCSTGTRRRTSGLKVLAILLLLGCGLGQPVTQPTPAEAARLGPLDLQLARAAGQSEVEYVPPRASAYALQPSEVGNGFRKIDSRGTPDDRSYRIWLQAPDARREREREILSNTDISFLDCQVYLGPPGSSDAASEQLQKLLASRKVEHGATVAPVERWSSEQVYSFNWSEQESVIRGYALQHRNAIVLIEARGKDELMSWDRIARLTQIVEGRIHAAVQRPEPSSD